MKTRPQNGFTLVEMAIVLALIGLILGTGLTLLSAQQDQRHIEETRDRLNEAREALIGFAITRGRLPCPATNASNGEESFTGAVGTTPCTIALNGFLPARTLGMTNVDGGYLQDAWQTPQNRIRYAVTTANLSTATTNDGIQTTSMGTFAPDLHVCDTTPAGSAIGPASCNTATTLTSDAVAVIYSLGANATRVPAGGVGVDEAANLDNNKVFVSHSIAFAKDAPANGEFDDQITWLSRFTLYNRMVQAGKLP